MEKIFINPVSKEIIAKGNAKEGPVDLFSYDNNGNGRALGSLYVVGNIQGGVDVNSDDIDVGYVLNLVASLAKREYYTNPDASPKDAFSGALKKINGVVEEFFKNKETKINIGIFAVAGDQIHISKLGKFKILLARENKTIDILNNIQLFNKESTQEKEFSNIISGKVIEGDRILAFYPSRSITAREKSIKDGFLKSSQDEFVAQLTTLKEQKPEFACAALHIDIQKDSETATAPHIQPKELQEEVVEVLTPTVQLANTDNEEYAVTKEAPAPVAKTIAKLSPEPAIPKIIPSEFARGKRELAFSKHFRQFKNMNITPRIKVYAMGGIAVVALLTIFSLKSFVFVNAETRQLNAAISEAQANLKLADTKKDDDLIGARSLLIGSLASLTQAQQINGTSKKAEDTKAQINQALDNIEGAVDATISLAPETISTNIFPVAPASPILSYAMYKGNRYELTAATISKITDAALGKTRSEPWLSAGIALPEDPVLITVDGNVYVLSGKGVLAVYYKGKKINEFNTVVTPEPNSLLLSNETSPDLYLVNPKTGRIYTIAKSNSSITKTLKINAPIQNAVLGDEGIFYILSDDKIWKVI